MHVALRWMLGLGALAALPACGHRDPALNAMEAAVRADLGPDARPHVGYVMPDSTRLLVDFEATVLHDTTLATFDSTARHVATIVARRYSNASRLVGIEVAAGETLRPGAFRVLRHRTVPAMEFR